MNDFLIFVIIWVFMGIVSFFIRIFSDSLARKTNLCYSLNGLSAEDELEIYYVIFVLLHILLMPIGFFMMIADLLKFLILVLSE